MKVEALMFNGIAVFFAIVGSVYAWWSRGEPIGTTALFLTMGLTGLVGLFFWFVSRRIDPRPEDRKDAEIAEGAGELGFFSPSSYWPFAVACAAAVMGIALAFYYLWLIIIAALMLTVTVGGLIFEYYVGQNTIQN